MKQKDLFVAMSFAVFAVGLGLLIKQTSTVIPDMKNPASAMDSLTPAAGEETVAEPVTETVTDDAAKPEAPVSADNTDKINITEATKLRSIGPENAPVVIENFSALSCPHCATFHRNTLPEIKKEYIDTGKVRVIFHPFPINEASLYGALLLQCVPESKFERMADLLYSEQSKWTYTANPRGELFNIVRITGISEKFFNDCMENKEIVAFIQESVKKGMEKYGITGTPAFVFNEGKEFVRGDTSYLLFKQKIDTTLNNGKK